MAASTHNQRTAMTVGTGLLLAGCSSTTEDGASPSTWSATGDIARVGPPAAASEASCASRLFEDSYTAADIPTHRVLPLRITQE